MKKLLSLVAAMIIATTIFAQVDEVTLTVIGTGQNEEQATLQALRSAIEQSFGTFVSANTTVLNDELVQDEIVSTTTGNVKEYKKLAVATLPNGQVSVSIKATVSVNKLISYAKSKGSRAEFAGQTFSANLKIMQLRAKSTQKTMDLLLQQLDKIAKDMFEFKIKLDEPKKDRKKAMYYLYPTIEVWSNEASTNFYNLLLQTLETLILSEEDIKFCGNNNIEYVKIALSDDNSDRGIKLELPIASDYWRKFYMKLQEIMDKAYCRVMISEIGNPNNSFYCADMVHKNKIIIDRDYFRSWNQWAILRSEYGRTSEMSRIGYTIALVSKHENKFVTNVNYFQNIDYGTMSNNRYKISKSFCLKEIRTPLKLTNQQKKELKKGTYTGPTYSVKYENPQLLLTLITELPVDYKRMTTGTFQGFEIKY